MAKLISSKPALLLEQLRQLKVGLVKYATAYTPASPTEAELDSAITALEGAAQMKQDAAGAAETATQTLYKVRDNAVDVARRMRDAVYAHFGKNDARIVEFGMDTLPRRVKRNGSDTSES